MLCRTSCGKGRGRGRGSYPCWFRGHSVGFGTGMYQKATSQIAGFAAESTWAETPPQWNFPITILLFMKQFLVLLLALTASAAFRSRSHHGDQRRKLTWGYALLAQLACLCRVQGTQRSYCGSRMSRRYHTQDRVEVNSQSHLNPETTTLGLCSCAEVHAKRQIVRLFS